jgi:hypothetical protein
MLGKFINLIHHGGMICKDQAFTGWSDHHLIRDISRQIAKMGLVRRDIDAPLQGIPPPIAVVTLNIYACYIAGYFSGFLILEVEVPDI